MDFSVKDIKMGVDNIANGNSLIRKQFDIYIYISVVNNN